MHKKTSFELNFLIKNKNKISKANVKANGGKRVIGVFMRVFDIKITDTECKAYRGQGSQKYSTKWNNEERQISSFYRNQNCSSLVHFVDVLAWKETRDEKKRFASLLATMPHTEYSEIASFVCTCMNLAIIRANITLHQSSQERRRKKLATFVQLEDGATMNVTEVMRYL